MIIAFVIWSIVAALFLAIGIGIRKSKNAVGFFTGVKPPEVKDIKRYNHAVSKLWIVVAVILEIMGIPFLFIEQNTPVFIFLILGVVALVIGMAFVYIKIESKYKA